jgi:Lipocalin-like domain
MNSRNILSLSAIAALGFVLMPGTAASQQKSLKDQLLGAWNVVAWERTAPDGTKVHAFGTNPKGVSYFGADGRFFVLFTRGELPKLASNDRTKSTPEEAKAILDAVIAYSGTYTVDEASKTIVYRLEFTTFPNQPREQKRLVSSITADELKHTNPGATAGGKIEVTFKRAPAAAMN